MDILAPPAIYDHAFAGRIFKNEYYASEVDSECRKIGLTGPPVRACSLHMGAAACIVIIPWFGVGGVGKRTYDLLLRHEIGHCNGWASDHAS